MAACVLLAVVGVAVFAQVSRAPAIDQTRSYLGAHALVGQEDRVAEAVAHTPALATEDGSTLLAFVGSFTSNDAVPSDNLGNRWRPLQAPELYRGYDGRFSLGAWLARDIKGGHAQVISVEKPGVPAGELTLVALELRNAGRLVDSSRTYPDAGLQLRSGTVTTDGPALLVAAWWGDGMGLRHFAEPGDGFDVVERFTRLPPNSAVQAVVATRQVDKAGTYSVDWYNAPSQGAILWLLAFAPERNGRDDGAKRQGRSAQ